jgi:hypothetical protein
MSLSDDTLKKVRFKCYDQQEQLWCQKYTQLISDPGPDPNSGGHVSTRAFGRSRPNPKQGEREKDPAIDYEGVEWGWSRGADVPRCGEDVSSKLNARLGHARVSVHETAVPSKPGGVGNDLN